jgi:hypothetical protein
MGLAKLAQLGLAEFVLADEPYNEAMGESHQAPLKTNNRRGQKSVWFHASEVDHGSHFLGTTTYG